MTKIDMRAEIVKAAMAGVSDAANSTASPVEIKEFRFDADYCFTVVLEDGTEVHFNTIEI